MLKDSLSYDEFLRWLAYFNERPVGWRDDDRTHKLLSTWGTKAKPFEVFSSLIPIYKPVNRNKHSTEGQIDVNNLKNSFLYKKMLSSKDGKKLEL